MKSLAVINTQLLENRSIFVRKLALVSLRTASIYWRFLYISIIPNMFSFALKAYTTFHLTALDCCFLLTLDIIWTLHLQICARSYSSSCIAFCLKPWKWGCSTTLAIQEVCLKSAKVLDQVEQLCQITWY